MSSNSDFRKDLKQMPEKILQAPEAIKKLRMGRPNPNYRPLIFVAAPFSEVVKGDREVLTQVRDYCRYIHEVGGIPICPQLYFPQFVNLHHYHDFQVMNFLCLVLLAKCEEVWSFGVPTRDMKFFIKKAFAKDIPVRYFNEDMEAW